jgi:hypothetical protein
VYRVSMKEVQCDLCLVFVVCGCSVARACDPIRPLQKCIVVENGESVQSMRMDTISSAKIVNQFQDVTHGL